jgi:hypothetical protein
MPPFTTHLFGRAQVEPYEQTFERSPAAKTLEVDSGLPRAVTGAVLERLP